MNIIFISPNYPAGHRRYVAALTEAGHTVLGIGDAGDETFAPELRGALKGYYRVGDLHDHDSVYRACRYFEWQFGRIQKIESLNPYWRDLVEALRAEVCTSYACVEREYHHLIKSGIDVSALTPRILSSSPKKVCAFAAGNSYPLLAIPATNKHLGQRLIASDAGVRSLLRGSTKDEYLFAVSPEGEVISVDGLMLDGKVVVCGAHVRAEDGQSVVAVAVDGLEGRCGEAAAQSGLADGFFHISAVRLTAASALGKKGAVCFVTFEPVPPHEYIIDLLDMEFGCDLRLSWAKRQVVLTGCEPCENWSERTDGSAEAQEVDEQGQKPAVSLPLERKYLAAAAVRSFERSYRNLHEKVLHKLGTALVSHGRTEEPDRFDYSDYIYLFTASTASEMDRSIKYITEDHPLPVHEKKAEETVADITPVRKKRAKK